MSLHFLLESSPTDPALKWFAVIVAFLTVVFMVFRPMFRKRDPLERSPSFGSLAQQRSVERQMQNVLVELSEMARKISAQLDTRALKLELLIKEADEKIAALRSAAAPAPSPEPAPRQTPRPAPEPEAPIDPRHAQVYALADQGRSSQEIAQQLNRPSGEIELILALRT